MKFTQFEKNFRKEEKRAVKKAGGAVASSYDGVVTIAVRPTGSGFHFGIASRSPKDKQKRKFGEFVALERLANCPAFFPGESKDGKVFENSKDFADFLLVAYNESRF